MARAVRQFGPRQHSRKRIRLAPEAYRDGDPFHICIASAHRREVFRDPRFALMVVRRLDLQMAECGGPILAYGLMLDHLHVLLIADPDLVLWVRLFKSATAAQAARLGLQGSLWQRSFYDRRLARTGEALTDVARYIIENPVHAGLVQRPEEWSYSRVSCFL